MFSLGLLEAAVMDVWYSYAALHPVFWFSGLSAGWETHHVSLNSYLVCLKATPGLTWHLVLGIVIHIIESMCAYARKYKRCGKAR
jgi:hypothetical protein